MVPCLTVYPSPNPNHQYMSLMTGTTELTYSIEDVLNDEMIQSGDTIALPPGGHLKSVFFSEEGVTLLTSYGLLMS